MGHRLPAAALSHPEWPIRRDHCFARVVLDAVYGRPWREVLQPPAWRNMDRPALERAVAIATEIEDGRADLQALNRRSLEVRRKLASGGAYPLSAAASPPAASAWRR